MKKVSIGLLLLAFIMTGVAPTAAYAKRGGDDDRFEYRSGSHHEDYDDDDSDEDEDEDDNDDNDDDDNSNDDDSSNSNSLEVEADVFTDMTIVKVELENGKKTVFRTNADTREEVIDVVADKFNLTDEEVDDVLDFEIENRATRAKERAKISGTNNNNSVDECDDSSSTTTLEVEADVFTDTTIVKVEKGNSKTVYESDATTSAAIVEEVADKFNLDVDDVEDVIDFEIEDRASRTSDFSVSSSSSDDCDDDSSNSNNNSSSSNRDAELKARVAELQKLIETLIRLLNLRLGSSN